MGQIVEQISGKSAEAFLRETFFEPLRVDPTRPAPISLRLPREALTSEGGPPVADAYGAIVRRGEVVSDPRRASAIRAYESARRPPRLPHLAAALVVHFLIVLMMTAPQPSSNALPPTTMYCVVPLRKK